MLIKNDIYYKHIIEIQNKLDFMLAMLTNNEVEIVDPIMEIKNLENLKTNLTLCENLIILAHINKKLNN